MGRRLGFTPLESRRMLALLGIGVQLYEDAGGVPGAAISDNQVQVGQSFFVEVTAEDLRDTPQGVNGLSLDLRWDAAALEVINDPFDPAAPQSPLVTSVFGGFRAGTLDEANTSAMIDNLRGLGPSHTGIGAGAPERFSLLHFRADAPSSSPLEIAIGDIGAGLVNYLRNLQPGDLAIAEPTITVVDGEVVDATPPELTIHGTRIVEGNAAGTSAEIQVQLSQPSQVPVQVRVNTRDDQATVADGDYLAVRDLTLEFVPGGPLVQTVAIPIVGDSRHESDERFWVELDSAENATIRTERAEVVIANDDQAEPRVAYTIQLKNGQGQPLDQDALGRYTVQAGDTLTAEVHVRDLADVPGGGVFAAFADLVSTSSQLTWNPGSLEIGAGFANGPSGTITSGSGGSGGSGLLEVDEAGGTAGTQPTGGGNLLLFRVGGTVAPAASPGTPMTIALNAPEGAGHETLVFGEDVPVGATYQQQTLIVVAADPPGQPLVPASPWQNGQDPLDVNRDGIRTPRDVLLIVNELNRGGPRLLSEQGPAAGEPWFDVNGDGGVSRLDALLIFNFLTFGTLPTDQTASFTAASFTALPAGSASAAVSLPTLPSDAAGGNAANLELSQALPLLAAATDSWLRTELTTEQVHRLGQVTLVVDDLETGVLGRTNGLTLILDADGAGLGWFVDPTPDAHEEFTTVGDRLLALDQSLAEGRFDLLTVISHELGHILGLEHDAPFADHPPEPDHLMPADQTPDHMMSDHVMSDHVMSAHLEPGERRLVF